MSTSSQSEEKPSSQAEARSAHGQEQSGITVSKNMSAGKRAMRNMLQPFAERNFSLLFGGQTISTIGDALYAVALPWLVLSNGGSAQELGLILTVYGIPRVGCILIGGTLSDRLRPRRLMLIADVVRAILVALLAVVAWTGHLNVWLLCAIALPLGAFQGLFMPASFAIIPAIVSDENLQAGNALSTASLQAASLVGSGLAGLVVAALTAATAIGIDALTFVVSALSLALMRVTGQPSISESSETAALSNEAGAQALGSDYAQKPISLMYFLRSSRLIQVVLLVTLAANISLGGLLEVALPTLARGPMHAGASGYGLIMAAFAGGALLGGLAAGLLNNIKRKGLAALLVSLVISVAFALLPYGGLFGALVCMLLAGISNSISNILLITVVQLTIPRNLMGRIIGAIMFTSLGTYPISVALGGVLTNRFGPVILFPFSGALLLLALLFGLAQRELRHL